MLTRSGRIIKSVTRFEDESVVQKTRSGRVIKPVKPLEVAFPVSAPPKKRTKPVNWIEQELSAEVVAQEVAIRKQTLEVAKDIQSRVIDGDDKDSAHFMEIVRLCDVMDAMVSPLKTSGMDDFFITDTQMYARFVAEGDSDAIRNARFNIEYFIGCLERKIRNPPTTITVRESAA